MPERTAGGCGLLRLVVVVNYVGRVFFVTMHESFGPTIDMAVSEWLQGTVQIGALSIRRWIILPGLCFCDHCGASRPS